MAFMDMEKMITGIQALDLIADGSTKDINRGFATVVVSIGDRKVIENAVYVKENFSDEAAEQYLRARNLQVELEVEPAA